MRFLIDRLPPGMRVGTPVLVSAAAVGVSAVVVAYGVGAIGKSLLQPSIDAEKANPLAALTEDSAEVLEKSRKRFDGRSMYALPPRPAPKVRVVEQPKPPDPPKVDLGPPPPAATYTGPAPSSVFGEYVFFGSLSEDDKRIKVGETKAGITVLEVNAPYSVKLGYQRGEYTVPLWARADDRLTRGDLAPARVNGVVSAAGTSASGASGPVVGGGSIGGAAAGGATGTAGAPGGVGSGAAAPLGGPAPRAGAQGGTATPKPASPSANPMTVPPGDEPGADVPSGPGPEGEPQTLPSAAMQPQRLPDPGSGEDAPPPEYVDRELLPPRLSDDEIRAMSEAQARAALEAINATDSWTIDSHNRARLDHERSLLRARLDRKP
jgi:hypothetical protein